MSINNGNDFIKATLPQKEFVSSGVAAIDKAQGGFVRGDITVIAGMSGNGKSLLALESALRVSQERKALYFSLENDESDDQERIKHAMDKYYIKDLSNFYYVASSDDRLGVTEFNEAIDEVNPDIIYIDSVDYLKITGGTTDAYQDSKAYKSALVAIRAICRERNIPLIITAQLRPSINDILHLTYGDLEFKAITQVAYNIWIVDRKPLDPDETSRTWLIRCAKNRKALKDNALYYCMKHTHSFMGEDLYIDQC